MTPQEFSVIVQGPVIGKPGEDHDKQKTLQCLESIKSVLPGAEIIISTWKGSDCSHLFYDQLILNEDPGAISYNDHGLKNHYNNNNRQIVSTSRGLQKASRKYAIKMRGDFILKDTSFFSLMNTFTRVNKYHFFKHRILVPDYVSRDPETIPLLFHMSDLFQVGYTKDLQDLWDIPLQPEPETTRAYPYNTRFINNPFGNHTWNMRFTPEQYIWYAFAKKKGLDLGIKYYCQTPAGITRTSLVSVMDNFIIASQEQLGIVIPATITGKFNPRYLYTHEKWKKLYEEICIKRSAYHLRRRVFLILLRSYKNILKNILKYPLEKTRSLLKK